MLMRQKVLRALLLMSDKFVMEPRNMGLRW
jgi:hypothetical protein